MQIFPLVLFPPPIFLGGIKQKRAYPTNKKINMKVESHDKVRNTQPNEYFTSTNIYRKEKGKEKSMSMKGAYHLATYEHKERLFDFSFSNQLIICKVNKNLIKLVLYFIIFFYHHIINIPMELPLPAVSILSMSTTQCFFI